MRLNKRGAQNYWLPAICVMLGACASDGPTERHDRIDAKEIAAEAGCKADEVAVCIEVDCQPEEYKCAARDDVVELFKARDFRH